MKRASDFDLEAKFVALVLDELLIALTKGAYFPRGVRAQLSREHGKVAFRYCKAVLNLTDQVTRMFIAEQNPDPVAAVNERLAMRDLPTQYNALMIQCLNGAAALKAEIGEDLRNMLAEQFAEVATEYTMHAVGACAQLVIKFPEGRPDALTTIGLPPEGNDAG